MSLATATIAILLGGAPVAAALLGNGWRWKLRTIELIAIDAVVFGLSHSVLASAVQVAIYAAACLCAYQCWNARREQAGMERTSNGGAFLFGPFRGLARAARSALARLPNERRRPWIAGIVVVGIAFTLFIGLSIVRFMSQSKLVAPYGTSVASLVASQEADAQLGAPLSAGAPTGSISVRDDGHTTANLCYSVRGAKANGTVFVDATRDANAWKIERLQLEIDDHPGRISLD